MKSKLERRAFDVTELEVRSGDGESKKIIGYAARFNKLSVPMWGFREQIAPGAFADSIQKDDIRALWNHDSSYVLGRNKAGTLKLDEDDKGLRIEITPPETQWAQDLMESIRRKDVNQMSFGFNTEVDEWDSADKKNVIRTLKKVSLFDVSPVTYPAYPQTSVGVRTAEQVYEDFLSTEADQDDPSAESRTDDADIPADESRTDDSANIEQQEQQQQEELQRQQVTDVCRRRLLLTEKEL